MSLLDRVRSTISEHALFAPGDKVVIGVSGGADSLALLHALVSLRDELHISLHIAHLNHQLRGAEAQADAEFVARLARDWNLPSTVETRDVAAWAREHRLSLEEAGRQVRYHFLGEVAAQVRAQTIAVAHNADDQVETVLMHFLRGAGLAGLRGMEYKVPLAISLVRPLLDVPRREIETYCRENGLTPRWDPSNEDTTFFRNRLRRDVIPYLENLNPNLRQVILRTARVVQDDYDFLQSQVRDAYTWIARKEGGEIVFALAPWRALHPSLQRGTLRMAVQELKRDLRDVDWTPVKDARRIALEKETGAQATLPGGLMLTLGYGELTIGDPQLASPLPDLPLLHVERVELAVPGVVSLRDSNWQVVTTLSSRLQPADRWSAAFDLDKCQLPLALRRRSAGDRFRPAGMQGHKSLHEFMIDEKIPRAARDRLPLLVAGDRILWVCGWRVDETARVTENTQKVVTVAFTKKP